MPVSNVLDRVRSFLPEMKQSTLQLQERIISGDLVQNDIRIDCGSSIHEESSSDDESGQESSADEQYIEMSLGLGVFDVLGQQDHLDTLFDNDTAIPEHTNTKHASFEQEPSLLDLLLQRVTETDDTLSSNEETLAHQDVLNALLNVHSAKSTACKSNQGGEKLIKEI